MNDEQTFWFLLATENLIASVLLVLYYRTYHREFVALVLAFIYFLYSALFVLVAGVLRNPESWQIGIGIMIVATFPGLIFMLIKRVMWGDD